ncbi:hypothetical protein [Pseudoclavibacter sp. 13-3]|uniref:hypothetical protein n=1 Tax=Pseudoclavibacter sp. 13-3 TaxID=2901228 RepID=UPI001E4E9BA9|nr:hypothetical protein [Pseudoclavibacter sp. 13-3]MCD7101962.1 hypothetical protein [Pseudoclavibacter sp. 13-3]
MSRAEVAAALGVSKSTLAAALRDGAAWVVPADAVIGSVEGWTRASVERMSELRAGSSRVRTWAAKKGI